MSQIQAYVDDLFRYIETYESNYQGFEVDGFLQTYNGIGTVFQASRQQRDKAIELDNLLSDKVKSSPVTSSDLRQSTIQLLVTYFESVANIDGQSGQTYAYCRGLRPVKQDIPFFEHHLLPLLFEPGALNGNFRLNKFFLSEIGRYMNEFGSPVKQDISPEEFNSLSVPMRFLTLIRRRQQFGEDLITDRTSLEFHLQRVNEFTRLAQRNKLAAQYIDDWKYIQKESFWTKILQGLSELLGKFKGAFSSWGYTRLVISQRNPAFVVYSLIVVLFLALAVYVPVKWLDYKEQRFEELVEHAEKLRNSQR